MDGDAPGGARRGRRSRTGSAGEPVRVLFVCTGNICRSPTAELMLRDRMGDVRGLEISSAGIGALVGHGIDEVMRPGLEARGLEASGFRARQITGELVERSDLIFTMTCRQRDWILEEWPLAVRSTVPLGAMEQLARTGPPSAGAVTAWRQGGSGRPVPDVRDPYGKGSRIAEAVTAYIDQQVGVLAGWLVGAGAGRGR